MRKLLPLIFASVAACSSNTREHDAPRTTEAPLAHLRDVPAVDTAPPMPVRAPTIGAGVEIDAPTLTVAAGNLDPLLAGSDGTSFVAAWEARLGYVTSRTRWERIASDGTILDRTGVTLPGTLMALSSGPGASLVVTLVGGTDLVATRMGADGKRLDAAPLVLGKSFDDGTRRHLAVADFDGTQWVVVYDDGTAGRITHVSTAGVVTPLPASASAALTHPVWPEVSGFTCASSGTCLLLWSEDNKAQLVGPAGLVGSSFDLGTRRFWNTIASNGTDFLAVRVEDGPRGVYLQRVSAAGVASAPTFMTTTGFINGSGLAGTSTHYTLAFLDFTASQIGAMRFPATGAVDPTWTGVLAGPTTENEGPGTPAILGSKVLVPISDLTKISGVIFDDTSAPTALLPRFDVANGAPGQYQSAVATDGSTFVVAWFEERGDRRTLRTRQVDATGKPLDAAPNVIADMATGADGLYGYPPTGTTDFAMAFDGTRHHLTWRTPVTNLSLPLWHALVGVDGKMIGTPDKLDSGGYVSRAPSIAGGGGRALVTWVEAGSVFARRFDTSGVALDAVPLTLGSATFPTPDNDARTAVSFDGKRWLVTWPTAAGASSDLGAAFVDETTTKPVAFALSTRTGTQQYPGAASDGKVHLVAWSDIGPDGKSSIAAVRVDAASGKILDDPPRIVLEDIDATVGATVTWDGAAFVVAAARPGAAPETRKILLARVRADGAVVGEPAWSIATDGFFPRFSRRIGIASNGTGTTLTTVSSLVDDAPYMAPRLRTYAFVAKRPAGATCTAKTECDDGNCVDGVCCQTACEGPCEACDVAGSLGVCVAATGKPHGTRTCGGASTDACATGACDGKDRTKCALFAIDVGGACAAPVCKGTSFVATATCNATHACIAPATVECAPYRCAPTGCLKSCTGDEQCQDRATCLSGSCVPSATGGRCSDDGLSSIGTTGVEQTCAPYRCDTTGGCGVKCANSADCIAGFVCDVGAGVCQDASASGGSSGGCNVVAHDGGDPLAASSLAIVVVAGCVSWLRRRRRQVRAAVLAAACLVLGSGCRSSTAETDPAPSTVVRSHADALKVAAESTTVDATDSVASGVVSAIACHATGCLVVQLRPPWIVGVRLDATGKAVDPNGFVIAASGDPDSFGGAGEVAVGTDGKDFLVMWTRGFLPNAYVRVTSDGKVPDAPRDVVALSNHAFGPFVGWDGKTWVVAWTEGVTGHAVVEAVRIDAAGASLDPTGIVVLDGGPTGDVDVSSMSCDAVGCTLGGRADFGKSFLARLVDGKLVGTPVTLGFPVASMMRSGADLVVVTAYNGPAGYGTYIGTFTPEGVAKIALKQIDTDGSSSGTIGETAAGLVLVADGRDIVTSAGRVVLRRLDASLDIVQSLIVPETIDPSIFRISSSPLGGALFVTGQAIRKVTTGPLAIARQDLEHRAAPHQFPATASDGTSHFVAFARRADGHDAVLIAKVDAGVIAPAAGTLVANETDAILDVAMTWDGTQYVVVWTTTARAAFSRVNASGTVLDVGGRKITDNPSGASANAWCGLAVTGTPTGSMVVIGDESRGLLTARLSTAGAVVDAAPNANPTPRYSCFSLAAASHAGTTLVVWPSLDLVGIRVGADGKAIDTTARILAAWGGPGSNGVLGRPAITSDATGWIVAYGDNRPGSLGADIRIVHDAFDLSDVPTAPFLVSARDPDQLDPSLVLDASGRALITWRETSDVADELRGSLVDVAAKKVLVDAASIASFGPGELDRSLVASFAGAKADLVYGRWEPDPTILAPRIKARTITFGALGAATCTTSDDCELGPCVDGVCCDRACDGPCEACNETGSAGKCITVAGKPRGKRACAGAGGCAEATCDGITATTCEKFAHAFETKCAEPTCKGALFTSTAYCDGRGTCAVPTTASCAPYICDASGCLTSCTTSASCAEGFACRDHKCVAKEGAACADDGLSSMSLTDGTTRSCVPFRCAAEGSCGTTCNTSADCAPGFSCDESHACVGSSGGDSGGCSVVTRAVAPDETYSTLGLLATLMALRRRRAAHRAARPRDRRG